jgi:hypothetical protein
MGTFVANPKKKERILANVLANQEKYPNFNHKFRREMNG